MDDNTSGADVPTSDANPTSGSQQFLGGVAESTISIMNDVLRYFITSIRLLETTQFMTGDVAVRAVADLYSSSILFGKELRSIPAIHTELRNFLDSKRANLQQHSSRRIMMILANNVYEDEGDRNGAVDIVKELFSAGRRNTPSGSMPPSASPRPEPSATKRVWDPVKWFTMLRYDSKRRTKRLLGISGNVCKNSLMLTAKSQGDYCLTAPQRKQFLHNLLRRDDKIFYLDVNEGYDTSFQQAVDMVEKEYNYHVRKTESCIFSSRSK